MALLNRLCRAAYRPCIIIYFKVESKVPLGASNTACSRFRHHRHTYRRFLECFLHIMQVLPCSSVVYWAAGAVFTISRLDELCYLFLLYLLMTNSNWINNCITLIFTQPSKPREEIGKMRVGLINRRSEKARDFFRNFCLRQSKFKFSFLLCFCLQF